MGSLRLAARTSCVQVGHPPTPHTGADEVHHGVVLPEVVLDGGAGADDPLSGPARAPVPKIAVGGFAQPRHHTLLTDLQA